ncbi:MAG: hypothetical protein ACTS3F_11250 [Phycisphaerales bacterium]
MRVLKLDIGMALVVAGLCAATPTIGLAPARESRETHGSLVGESEELRARALRGAERMRSLEMVLADERKRLAGIGEVSALRIPLNQRIARLNTLAEDHGLEVVRLSPRREVGGGSDGAAVGLDFSLMGEFGAMVRMLEAIETRELSLWAASFEIARRADRAGWVTLSGDLAWHADSAGD